MSAEIGNIVALHYDGWMVRFRNEKLVKPYNTEIGHNPATIMAFSSKNKWFVYCYSDTAYFYDYTTEELVNTLSVASGSTQIEFSRDDDYVFFRSASSVRIYKTSDWSLVHTYPASVSNTISISQFGQKMLLVSSVAPHFRVITFNSTWDTVLGTVELVPTGNLSHSFYRGSCFSLDGSKVLLTSGNDVGSVQVFDTVSATQLDTKSYVGGLFGSSGVPRLSPDGSTWAVGSITNNAGVYLLDTTTYAGSFVKPNAVDGTVYAYDVGWVGNDALYVSSTKTPAITKYTPSTGEWDHILYGEDFRSMAVSSAGSAYKLTGTIVESLLTDEWRCAAYSLVDGSLQGITTSGPGAFEIIVDSSEPMMVVVGPLPADRWNADESHSIGDLVYPTNPSVSPFYHKCIGAGVSASSEPTWSTTSGGNTNDGTVVWEMVEGLAQPIAHMPLSPVPA